MDHASSIGGYINLNDMYLSIYTLRMLYNERSSEQRLVSLYVREVKQNKYCVRHKASGDIMKQPLSIGLKLVSDLVHTLH